VESPLRLRFSAHGKDVDVRLDRAPSPVAPGAIVEQGTGNGSITTLAQESFIFSSPQRDAVLGFFGGGMHGLVSHGGSYFDFRAEGSGEGLEVVERVMGEGAEERGNATGAGEGASSGRKLEGVEMWNNCYQGQGQPHALSMGAAVATKVVERVKSFDLSVQDFVAINLAKANVVFLKQMNIFVELHKLLIAESSSAYPEWNLNGASCGATIDDQLDHFSWSEQADYTLWHIFDDCFGGSGTVGLAWGGTACMTRRYTRNGKYIYYNRGATWLPYLQHPVGSWHTFTHEVGHNLAAEHSFELGKGSTGGIMDYGDGTLDGYYQFNTPFRRKEVCDWLQTLASECKFFKVLEATCGNRLLEGGEACECADGSQKCEFCCGCRLQKGKQCSPSSLAGGACCTADGQFKPVGEKCQDSVGMNGYCFQGECRVEEECRWISATYSKRNSPNDCEYLCETASGTLTPVMSGWTVTSVFPVDTPCGGDGAGKCKENNQGTLTCLGGSPSRVIISGPTAAPQPAVPGTAKHTLPGSGCVGYGQQAFIGYPDIKLDSEQTYTFEQCHQACVAEPTCESFIHSEDKQYCELWTPIKQEGDLVHVPEYDAYICEGKAAGAYITDCERFAGDRVAPPGGSADALPDIGCPSCETNGESCGSSTGCGGFSLSQCNEACMNNPRCHIFVHGERSDGVVGYCELWSAAASIKKQGTVFDRRRLQDLDPDLADDDEGSSSSKLNSYMCPCRGEGKACPCQRSAVSKLRVPCRCVSTSANDCFAGMYCLPEGYCTETSDKSPDRRLEECGADYPVTGPSTSVQVDSGRRAPQCSLTALIIGAGTVIGLLAL